MDENKKDELNLNNKEQVENTHTEEVISAPVVADTPSATTKKNVFLLVWKIVVATIFVLVSAFIAYLLVDVANTPPPAEGEIDARGLGLAVVLIVLIAIGGIGYLANVITSIIGIIVSINSRKKGQCGVGSIVYFVVFTVLPIITFIVWLAVTSLIKFN